MPSHRRFASPLSLAIFVAGLIGAAASGIATYRALGMYGGPILSGFHSERDPRSGRRQLVHETTTRSGLHVRELFDEDFNLQQTILSGALLGAISAPPNAGTIKTRVGFSTANDGVIDAWITRDQRSDTASTEVSTKRNGKIDRWERYVKGQLVRVDLDTNGNGKPDRWMTYEAGILMETFIDNDEDGRADPFGKG